MTSTTLSTHTVPQRKPRGGAPVRAGGVVARGEGMRAGGVPLRKPRQSPQQKIEAALGGYEISSRLFTRGVDLFLAGRVHPLSGLRFRVDGDTDDYEVDLAVPVCGCESFKVTGGPRDMGGSVCKHIVAAARKAMEG